MLQSGIKRAQEEKALFVDEATAAQEKIKELNEMLSALNKAKELTVKELKAVSEARDAVKEFALKA